MTIDPTVQVAIDLTRIVELYADVLAQAINKAGAMIDGHSLPGGEAMVTLAPVADPEEFAEQSEAIEWQHLARCTKLDHTRCWTGTEDEDPDEAAPVLQVLQSWTKGLRRIHGLPLEGRRPTVATEANIIRYLLDWVWDNEPHWDQFAKSIAKAKTRLENMLAAGTRVAFSGAPCFNPDCDGKSNLIRKTVPARGDDGEKTWRLTDWHCPKCKESWSEVDYALEVEALKESLHYRNIDGEVYCTVDRAAKRVGRPPATVWSWINRVEVGAVCEASGSKRTLVHVIDVEQRHDLAIERARRHAAAKDAKRITLV